MKKAIREGRIRLGALKIGVAVLDDGTHVITEEGLENFLKILEGGDEITSEDAEGFAKALSRF